MAVGLADGVRKGMSQGTVYIATGRFFHTRGNEIKKLLRLRFLRRIIVFPFFAERMGHDFIDNKTVSSQKADAGCTHIGPAKIQCQIGSLLPAVRQVHIRRQGRKGRRGACFRCFQLLSECCRKILQLFVTPIKMLRNIHPVSTCFTAHIESPCLFRYRYKYYTTYRIRRI